MASLPKELLYYGAEEPLPDSFALRAGPLSLLFEAGDLRYVRLGHHEILRRVYVAVRDRNWGTVPPAHSNLKIESEADSFRISYDCEHRQGEIDFFWRGAITGDPDGTITFSMDGEARSTFLRNRIGFCVLHPIRECAGQLCVVEHSEGPPESGTFPRQISPHQPFFDIRAISHLVLHDLRAEVRFAGDVFEIEDQRNWTDASYKTYCTPIATPYPVEIKKGERVRQSVTLTLHRDEPSATSIPRISPEDRLPVRLTLRESERKPLPSLGLGVASHSHSLSEREIDRLRVLNLAHLRVDLPLSGEYVPLLRRATTEANALDVPLEVALLLTDDAENELQSLTEALMEIQPRVCRWIVFPSGEKATSARWMALARQCLSDYAPDALFGGDSNADFVDLNRFRPSPEAFDFISFAMNPQVHAFDNASLVETLEAQPATVESAREFIDGLPLYISPITLKRRFNPDATGPEAAPPPCELPAQVDPRQMSLFGAGWTLGCLKSLSESGVEGITLYETTGWRGVMETDAGSPLPERFRSIPGGVFPMYHVFADVGEFAGGEVVTLSSNAPLSVVGMALQQSGHTRLLVANLSPDSQPIQIELPNGRVRVRMLDETNAFSAMEDPEAFREDSGELVPIRQGKLDLELLPFATARIDLAP